MHTLWRVGSLWRAGGWGLVSYSLNSCTKILAGPVRDAGRSAQQSAASAAPRYRRSGEKHLVQPRVVLASS